MRTLSLLTLLVALPVAAQIEIPVGYFESVELRHGGNVVVRQGPVQRVTMLSGDPRYSTVQLEGKRLVIENRGGHSRDYRLEVEVVTPELESIAVSNGGTMQTAGEFSQARVEASVEQGGRLDIRSITADAVIASVDSGGGIFTNPRKTLDATVTSGGAVTYWGDPRVNKTVRDGGVVQRGKLEDARKPLPEMGKHRRVIAPQPPVPPVPPIPN